MTCSNIYYMIMLAILSLIVLYWVMNNLDVFYENKEKKEKDKKKSKSKKSKSSTKKKIQKNQKDNNTGNNEVKIVEEEYNPKAITTGKAASKNIFLESDMVETARQVNLLINWIPGIGDTKLLYKAGGSDIIMSDLYKKIEGKGKTLVLLRVTDLTTKAGYDNVIGIYTSKGFNVMSYKYLDSESFIFDLYKSTKYSIPSFGKSENAANISKYGISYDLSKGPSIGTDFSISGYQGSYFVNTNSPSLVNGKGKADGPFGKSKKQKKITNVEAWQIV